MTFGNVGALVQGNVKRLLAYSSIAHAGYLLVAFAMTTPENSLNGISAAMFYTAAYAAMNVGAFAVVSHFANAGERYVTWKIMKVWDEVLLFWPLRLRFSCCH